MSPAKTRPFCPGGDKLKGNHRWPVDSPKMHDVITIYWCWFSHKPCQMRKSKIQWRHNERGGFPNYRLLGCLLNRLFRSRSRKISKLLVTGPGEGNSSMTGEFPAQRASNAERVSVGWRHHGCKSEYHFQGYRMYISIDIMPYDVYVWLTEIKSANFPHYPQIYVTLKLSLLGRGDQFWLHDQHELMAKVDEKNHYDTTDYKNYWRDHETIIGIN